MVEQPEPWDCKLICQCFSNLTFSLSIKGHHSLKWVPAACPKAKYHWNIMVISFIPTTWTNRITTRCSDGFHMIDSYAGSYFTGYLKKKSSLFKNWITIAFVTCDRFSLSLPPFNPFSPPLSLLPTHSQHWHPGYFHAVLHNWSLSRWSCHLFTNITNHSP